MKTSFDQCSFLVDVSFQFRGHLRVNRRHREGAVSKKDFDCLDVHAVF